MVRFVGLTRAQTGNRVVLQRGEEAQLSCAADILLTGLFQDLRGETLCRVCGAEISLEVRGRRVFKLVPQGSVLHYLRFRTDDPKAFGVVCESTFMFDTPECAQRWTANYRGPPGRVVTPDEFLKDVAKAKGLPRSDC